MFALKQNGVEYSDNFVDLYFFLLFNQFWSCFTTRSKKKKPRHDINEQMFYPNLCGNQVILEDIVAFRFHIFCKIYGYKNVPTKHMHLLLFINIFLYTILFIHNIIFCLWGLVSFTLLTKMEYHWLVGVFLQHSTQIPNKWLKPTFRCNIIFFFF